MIAYLNTANTLIRIYSQFEWLQDHINPLAENQTDVKLSSLDFFGRIVNILNALTINMLYILPKTVLDEAERFKDNIKVSVFQLNIFDNIWSDIEYYKKEAI